MSNYTRVSLFKVLVLWFSLLFSALCSHSILTADLINYQMTVYKVFHRASFMRLIQVLNWAAASSRVSYRLSHVTAAIHQPCCISTTLFLFVAQYDASLVLLSSPPPRSSVLLSVPLPPFPLLLPSLIWLIQRRFLPLCLSSRWSLPCQAAGPGGGTELRLH